MADDAARDAIRALRADGDPWARDRPLHLTASALVLHPPTGRILLRWHPALGGWLQVGGHGEPGETDPLAVALREAAEETGLDDLRLHPATPGPVHTVIVAVPADDVRGEPAHRHADLRYLLVTDRPERVRPEHADAPLRWCGPEEARVLVGEDNLAETLRRIPV